jgi:hypothetical protein
MADLRVPCSTPYKLTAVAKGDETVLLKVGASNTLKVCVALLANCSTYFRNRYVFSIILQRALRQRLQHRTCQLS